MTSPSHNSTASPPLILPRRWLSLAQSVGVFAVVLLVSLWAAVFVVLNADHKSEIAAALKNTANLARSFEEHTRRTIEEGDQLLHFLIDQQQRGLKPDLRRIKDDSPIIHRIYNYLSIADERGELVAASEPFKPTNISDLEHFRLPATQNGSQLFISKPVVSRATGKTAIQLSRRINHADGSFGGVAIASISPDYFSRFYRELDLGQQGVVSLIGRDGIVRARHAGDNQSIGQDVSAARLFDKYLNQNLVGSFVQNSNVDGVRRIVAYRALSEYPLVVLLGMAESEALAMYYQRARNYYLGATLATLLILGFSVFLCMLIARRNRSENKLRESEQHHRQLIEALPVALYTSDAEGRITLFNQAAVALWGRTPEIGKDKWCGSWRIYDPNDGQPVPLEQCPMALTIRDRTSVRGSDIVVERPDGARRNVLPHPQPLLDTSGQVIGAVNVLIDITERRSDERDRARLAAIVENSNDAIISRSVDGIIQSWNKAAQRMFGWTQVEAIGRSTEMLIPPKGRGHVRPYIEPVKAGESVAAVEALRVHKDGSYIQTSVTFSRIGNAADDAASISMIYRDITERKRLEAEAQRKASLTLLQEALARAANEAEMPEQALRKNLALICEYGGWELGRVGIFEGGSLYGIPRSVWHCRQPERFAGFIDVSNQFNHFIQHAGRFVTDSLRRQQPIWLSDFSTIADFGRLAEAMKNGIAAGMVFPVVVNGNSVAFLEFFATEVREADTLFLAALGSISSQLARVIERRQALDDALAHRQELDSILGTLQEVVWSMDAHNGRLLYINAAVWQLTRRPASNFLDQPRLWRRLVHRDDRVAVGASIRKLLRAGELVHEFRIVLADGSERTVESRARVRHGRNGKIIRIDGTIIDITERKLAQRALHQLNQELEDKVTARTTDLQRARFEAEEANRAKSQFLAAMSHEIRTPMNGVVGMIDVLHRTSLGDDQMEMVNLIRESAFSLLGILDDILDLSKIEAGKLDVDRQPFTVSEVVDGVSGLLSGMAEKQDVMLTVYTDPALTGQVVGDAFRLRQVLINLASNAIKFSSGQAHAGHVSLRVQRVEQSDEQVTVVFEVSDNGIGMDQQTQAKIFSAFTQADVSTTRRYGGSGLGLSIAHQLVTLMGGSIAVQSAPGEGTTFNVRLPFFRLPDSAATTAPESEVAGLSCVVVGKNGGLAEDYAGYLEHAQAQVARISHFNDTDTRARPDGEQQVWIADASDARLSPAMRDTLRARIEHSAHCAMLLIERGKRRRLREVAPRLYMVDGNALTRRTFLRSVAIAAGRADLETETRTPKRGMLMPIAPSREEALRRGCLILVAEDNAANQKVIARQLAVLGYAADVAVDGSKAHARWKSGDYALLLTDLHMPNMDGYALTRAIRTEEKGNRRMPIIATTADVVRGEPDKCREAGMDGYLRKPSPLSELQAVLEQWLPNPDDDAVKKPPAVPGSLTQEQQHAIAVPVDVEVLKAMVGDDPQVVEEFLQTFRVSASATAAELIDACANGQILKARDIAHQLKSVSCWVGAAALSDVCIQMEQAGDAGDVNEMALLLHRFRVEMASVERYLSAFGASKARSMH